MSSVFRFKQFSVQQDKCAMKIGTDGVLLGAWTALKQQPSSILDVGAGTGVIALMLAQRSSALDINALEINDKAYEQCVENFEHSPWSDRLFCYHADFKKFVAEMDDQYQLIVSNPPFFDPPKQSNLSSERQMARFTQKLALPELISGAAHLLDHSGQFSIIIPFELKEKALTIAAEKQLYPNRITDVRGTPESSYKRSLMQFGFEQSNLIENKLTIETKRHQYTDEYKALTKAFYLKM